MTLNVVQWGCQSNPVSADVANVVFDDVFGNSVALVELSYQFTSVPNLPVDMYGSSFGPGTQCSVVSWNSEAPACEFI